MIMGERGGSETVRGRRLSRRCKDVGPTQRRQRLRKGWRQMPGTTRSEPAVFNRQGRIAHRTGS